MENLFQFEALFADRSFMNFTRLISTIILLLLTGFIGMFFTNCSEVGTFESSLVTQEQESDVFKIGDKNEDSFEKISEYDLEVIGARLNEVEIDQLRPLSDLNDPNVRDLYLCPSTTNKYLICHIPGHLDIPAEEGCLSVEAVEQHMEHDSLLKDEVGDFIDAYDYLGPCRSTVF